MKRLISVFLIILMLLSAISLTSCDIAKIILGVFDLVKEDSTNIDLDFNFGAAHVHTEGVLPAVESTCVEHGKTEGRYCVTCEKVLVAQVEAPLKAHTYDNSVDAICNVCEHEREVGCYHINIEVLPSVESTCTQTGLTEGRKCKDCEEILVEQETTSIKDHTPTDWIIDKNPTANEEGAKHIECSVCKEVIYNSTIPVLAPESEGLEYTLNSDGKTYSVSGIGNCTSSDVVIAATYEGKPVTKIANYAFRNRTSIKSITIPNSVVNVGVSAFDGCSSIKNVYYQGGVEEWCKIYFSGSNANPLSKGANLYFNGALVVNLHIPSSVETIRQYAFKGCLSLENLTMDNSVTTIEESAFSSCQNLKKVTIGNFVSEIKSYAFINCESLTEITLSNSVRSIGYQAFRGCSSLKNVTIPYSVTSIGEALFYDCKALETVIIPDSVTSMGKQVFYNSPNLTIYCEHAEQPGTWNQNWNSGGCPVVWGYEIK